MKLIARFLAIALLLPTMAIAQVPLNTFQSGPRLINGDHLNKMVTVLNNFFNYSYQLVVAGSAFYTYTVPNNVGVVVYDIASGPISDVRVTAPASPYDGQQVMIASKTTITALQFIANTGQSLAATTPTVLTASTTVPQGYRWIYKQSNSTWYRLQ